MHEESLKICDMLGSKDKEMQSLGKVILDANIKTFGDLQRFKHKYLNGNKKIAQKLKTKIIYSIKSNLTKNV